MGAYNNVFKRVEKKYRLVRSQRAAVEAAADVVMAPDAYGRTRITSLYLDTPERAMIARSVERPLYKEKLRLRAYGEEAGALLMAAFAAGPLRREAGCLPLSDGEVQARVLAAALTCGVGGVRSSTRASREGSAGIRAAAASDALSLPVFFGIKKKFKGIVYKRRLVLSLPAALAFVSGLPYEQACTRWPVADADQAATALAPQTRQIARELVAAMDRHLPLVPSMGIACDRVAWALREGWAPADARDATDPGFRITFDNRLEYLDCFEEGWRPGAEAWRPIIAPGESIMEVKSASAYPPWLTATLSANAIYPASFTKYGNAYQMAS